MTTKHEYARSRAAQLERLKEEHGLPVYTGRVIVVGPDREDFGSELDPRTYQEVVQEYTKPVAFLYTLPGISRIIPLLVGKILLGNPAVSFADITRYEIDANRSSFKKTPYVTIFDKNGPVPK